jgi:hypothetical protein
MILAATLVVLAVSSVGIYKYRTRSVLPANGRAPLYAAEFTNTTDDAVFDDVLLDIVANELNRSPEVRVMDSDIDGLAHLLQSRGKNPDERFTPELAKQLCERNKGSFFTDGEIKPQGNGYVLDLSVRECGSGRIVAQQHSEAKSKDDVMHVASQLAANIRLQLSGNSANSPGNTPVPLPTASLPAYQAYLMGERLYGTQLKQSAAMLRRATQLDPGRLRIKTCSRQSDQSRISSTPSTYAKNFPRTKRRALKRVTTGKSPGNSTGPLRPCKPGKSSGRTTLHPTIS